VIENFSPRVFDGFQLTWELIQSLNPRASFLRMPAFGLDGPWRDRTAFSQTIEGLTGLAWRTGDAHGPPTLLRGACDPVAGVTAALGFLSALELRDNTGVGSFIEIPMVEAALNVSAELIVNESAYGRVTGRIGNRHPVFAPQGVYRCDGDDAWIAFTVVNDEQWDALCDIVEAPSCKTLDLDARRSVEDKLDELIAAWARKTTSAAAIRALAALDIPAAEVARAADVTQHPHLRVRRFVETIHHPLLGVHETLGFPFHSDGFPDFWVRTAAPTLGAHNTDVLTTLLSVAPDEIARLEAERVIGEQPL
jgi:crotonobetainyl-CoA:carnitine CoA-transferase CaiB-like acyl-CoA transferase